MRPETGGASRLRPTAAAATPTRKRQSASALPLTKQTPAALAVPTLASHRPRPSVAAAATPPSDGERSKEDIERILRSLEPSSSSSSSSPSRQQQQQQRGRRDSASSFSLLASSSPLSASTKNDDDDNNFFLGPPQGRGTFLLVLVNVAVFAVATLASRGGVGGPFASQRLSPFVASFALSHARPRWWQLLSCAFLHLDLQHLAGNLFSLLVFGRDIELAEGGGAVWLYYLVTAFFASLASLLFGPRGAVSFGASGAVFGLFAVAAGKVRPNLRSLLESAVLASFVVPQVLQEARSQALGGTVTAGGASVGHVAHLGGAAAGVLVVLLLSRLPAAGSGGA